MTPAELEHLLADAPDPELARVALSRVRDQPAARDALERDETLRLLVRLVGFSTAATDFLIADPTEITALSDVRPRGRDRLEAELAIDAQRLGDEAGIRRFRRRAMLRVAARDLSGARLEDVVGELTTIAEVCLRSACRSAGVDDIAVIGLGKLGGGELNYASDVDVVFVHRGAGPERVDAAERRCAAMIRLLSEPTSEGIALRVDTNLRPGGRAGALSRSLDAMREHYASHAATWERQALVKARPVAGDATLGEAFLRAVEPFVYPDELEPRAIDEVRRVKVRLEEYVRARGKAGREIKRGWGGIRDIEFSVQLLQIVHGRRDPRLRDPSTLGALAALAEQGYVGREDARSLADAYRFLRTLEHRLQIVRDLQTHELPSDPAARLVIARSLGLRDADGLQAEFERQTSLVRGLHEQLFYRPLLGSFAGRRPPMPGTEREATEELLAGLGFARPGAAYEILARVVDPGTRFGKVLGHVFPVMAPALALAPDPDAALVRLERVTQSVSDPEISDALANDPGAARRLAYAVGVSSFATDLLAASPRRILAMTSRSDPADPQAALAAVVARYAARELEPKETGLALSAVADRVVRDAVSAADADLPFAVIGLGKLGAQELNFASDLDLIFVYEGQGAAELRRASELAEVTLAQIRAAGWEPDADLRPEGKSGSLARSLAAYLEYWDRYAETWEFQSLLRARFVAGSEGLGNRFCSLANDVAYPEYLSGERVREIGRMRERIERERVRPPGSDRFHFKLGYGSLADVQFAVELSLMRSGGRHPEVRSRRTLEGIERLASSRLIEDGVARALGEAFVFLSDVKNALEVDRRVRAEAIPPSPEEQLALARGLGYEEYPRQTFLEDYRRITRRARRAMERVFHEEPD